MASVSDSDLGARWILRGEKALVTGGTRGLGRAIVEELAGLGVSMYTCARSQDSLQSSLGSWRQAGLRVDGSACDLSVREAREELLVNTVGTNLRKATVDYTREDLHEFMELGGLSIRLSQKFL